MIVESYVGYEGDFDVPNGTREVEDIYGVCDKCKCEMDLEDFAYKLGNLYVCADCFLEHSEKYTVGELVEMGEAEVIRN